MTAALQVAGVDARVYHFCVKADVPPTQSEKWTVSVDLDNSLKINFCARHPVLTISILSLR